MTQEQDRSNRINPPNRKIIESIIQELSSKTPPIDLSLETVVNLATQRFMYMYPSTTIRQVDIDTVYASFWTTYERMLAQQEKIKNGVQPAQPVKPAQPAQPFRPARTPLPENDGHYGGYELKWEIDNNK